MNMGAGQTNESATVRDSSKLRARSFVGLFLDWILAGLPDPAPKVADGPEIASERFRGFGSGSAVADDLAEPFLVSAMTETPGVTIRRAGSTPSERVIANEIARSLEDLVGDADDAIDGIPAKLIEEVASSPAVMPEQRGEDPLPGFHHELSAERALELAEWLKDEDPFAAQRDTVKGLAGHSIPIAEPTPAEELHEILEAQTTDATLDRDKLADEMMEESGVARDEGNLAASALLMKGAEALLGISRPIHRKWLDELLAMQGQLETTRAEASKLENDNERLRAELAATEGLLQNTQADCETAWKRTAEVEFENNELRGLAKARKRKLRRARRKLEEVNNEADYLKARDEARTPPTYDEAARDRAVTVYSDRRVGDDRGTVVDKIASALGMRKAGA